jgi:hypothetical protein
MSKRKGKQTSKSGSGKSGSRKSQPSKPESIALKVYAGVAAVGAAMVARKVAEKVWVKTTGKTPPNEPESPDVHWAEAIGWSLVSGTTVAVARLLATRKAASAWHRVSAQEPAAPVN